MRVAFLIGLLLLAGCASKPSAPAAAPATPIPLTGDAPRFFSAPADLTVSVVYAAEADGARQVPGNGNCVRFLEDVDMTILNGTATFTWTPPPARPAMKAEFIHSPEGRTFSEAEAAEGPLVLAFQNATLPAGDRGYVWIAPSGPGAAVDMKVHIDLEFTYFAPQEIAPQFGGSCS